MTHSTAANELNDALIQAMEDHKALKKLAMKPLVKLAEIINKVTSDYEAVYANNEERMSDTSLNVEIQADGSIVVERRSREIEAEGAVDSNVKRIIEKIPESTKIKISVNDAGDFEWAETSYKHFPGATPIKKQETVSTFDSVDGVVNALFRKTKSQGALYHQDIKNMVKRHKKRKAERIEDPNAMDNARSAISLLRKFKA